MKKCYLLLQVLATSLTLCAQDYPSFEKKIFVAGEDTLLYRIQYPKEYVPSKKYPVILFLHGSGERGNDNNKQLFWGADLFSHPANREKYPAIILMPQCPANDSWTRIRRGTHTPSDSLGQLEFESDKEISKPLQLVSLLLDNMVAAGQVNTKRLYVGGLSLGGMGTFELLWRKPGFFAAAFPICGGGDPKKVNSYGRSIACWVFHGEKDPVVLPAHSRRMVTALRDAGYKVRYSEYPGVQHDSWKNAFAEPELLSWMFAQKRRK